MTRVLIVDDSALFKRLLERALGADPTMKVVGWAGRGDQAVELTTRLMPDVITMDVLMPGMDGFEVVKRIMATRPTPILVVSSLEREKIVFKMLAAGALDVIPKPDAKPESMRRLVDRIRELAKAHVRASAPAPTAFGDTGAPLRPHPRAGAPPGTGPVVVIASSAGGPQALGHVLGGLPADLPGSIVVVQHIAEGFGTGFASWLRGGSALRVELAKRGATLAPGTILVAPDDAHVKILSGRRVELDHTSDAHVYVRPAADVTLKSAAEECGERLLAVILTGMGHDGAVGVQAVRAHGGRVIVQNEATSAVWGMPQASRPFADAELPLEKIPDAIVRFCRDRA